MVAVVQTAWGAAWCAAGVLGRLTSGAETNRHPSPFAFGPSKVSCKAPCMRCCGFRGFRHPATASSQLHPPPPHHAISPPLLLHMFPHPTAELLLRLLNLLLRLLVPAVPVGPECRDDGRRELCAELLPVLAARGLLPRLLPGGAQARPPARQPRPGARALRRLVSESLRPPACCAFAAAA